MKIDVIRHGEPVGGSRYRGSGVDDPLSERGWQQMWGAIGSFHDWGSIYSSPMKRCHEFAEQLALRNRVPLIVEQNLREIGFGQWEGKTRKELIEADAAGFAAFFADPASHTPQGAENVLDFQARIAAVFDKVISNSEEEQVLIVTHAGVIRAMLGAALHLSPEAMYRINITNAGITQFELVDDRLKLNFINGKLV